MENEEREEPDACSLFRDRGPLDAGERQSWQHFADNQRRQLGQLALGSAGRSRLWRAAARRQRLGRFRQRGWWSVGLAGGLFVPAARLALGLGRLLFWGPGRAKRHRHIGAAPARRTGQEQGANGNQSVVHVAAHRKAFFTASGWKSRPPSTTSHPISRPAIATLPFAPGFDGGRSGRVYGNRG
jgi:hypothetical protein